MSTEEKVKIQDVVVSNENIAFNLLVQFVHVAQKRGAYSLEESSKIWECVQMFQKKETSDNDSNQVEQSEK